MGENKFGKSPKRRDGRPVLGDITNNLGNVGLPLVSRKPESKPLIGNKRDTKNLDDDDDDSHFWKQVCLVVEKLEKEKYGVSKCSKVGSNDVGLSSLKGGKTYRLQSGSSNVGPMGLADDVNGGMGGRDVVVGSTLDSIDLGENQHSRDVGNVDGVVKEGGVLSECGVKNRVEIRKECQGEETIGLSDVGEIGSNPRELAIQVLSDDSKSGSESGETSIFIESQETRSSRLERCELLKDDGSHSLSEGVDLLKNCSCSFCTKAAYIWGDLQCQDVRGRISSLATSQKEAHNLAQRHSVETAMGVAQGTSITAPHLENDLTTLWKSLFLHMENNFAAETNELQFNLAALKDIREDYKMNLKMINLMLPEIQQCLSDDASDTVLY